MKLSQINTMLSGMDIPVAYNHFTQKTSIPYLVYYVENSSNFFADNKVKTENITLAIELYTTIKDAKLEKKLKDILNNNELPYEQVSETYIDSDNVYEIMYEVDILDFDSEE